MASNLSDLKVLVVEDSPAAAKLLQMVLAGLGIHQTFIARDGKAAQDFLDAADDLVDLIICDWKMPRMSGLELLCQVRTVDPEIPFMMVTGNADLESVQAAKKSGVDAYITKPFSPKELVARIKAVMRRISQMAVEEVIEMQGLSLDPTSHRVMAGEEPLEMGPTEFKLLHFFMTHPERVYSREQLLNHVWGTNVYVEDRTVDVHIRRLRKALEPGGHDRMVQTVRGTGYRFSTRF